MNEIKEITAQELKEFLRSDEKVLIVDVRSKEEFKEVHIEDAVLMELPRFCQECLEQKCANIDNLKKVVFQCRSGIRSKTAIKCLKDFPYEVYNLKGGIVSWGGLGYKVIVDDD